MLEIKIEFYFRLYGLHERLKCLLSSHSTCYVYCFKHIFGSDISFSETFHFMNSLINEQTHDLKSILITYRVYLMFLTWTGTSTSIFVFARTSLINSILVRIKLDLNYKCNLVFMISDYHCHLIYLSYTFFIRLR